MQMKAMSASVVVVLAVLLQYGQCEASEIYLESGGIVVGEAEAFSRRTNIGSEGWIIKPTEVSAVDTANGGPIISSARGGAYIQGLPNTDAGFEPLVGPSVEYDFLISTPGTYQLFLRWDGADFRAPEHDSIFADILQLKDGPGGVADHIQFSGRNDPNDPLGQLPDGSFATLPWDGLGGAEVDNAAASPRTAAVWDFTSPGVYTLRLGIREDGVAVDAFVLQLARLAAPTGTGPAISVTVLKGDVDMDGDVDFDDIAPFIAVLQAGAFQIEADCDCSTVVDFSDIPAFIAILQGQ